MTNFKDLNLSTHILSALEKKGYTKPTPIQEKSIPHVLSKKDLMGIAQTGTGKTAAFALPILDNLFKSKNQVQPNNIRTLILTPTRELASQIFENIDLYGQGLGLRYKVVFGGININPQIKAMKRGFDILVATPGRLLDLKRQGHIDFSQVETFVLDEADRMLDMGFIHDVRKIISKLPTKRQTLFFSATMSQDIIRLANSILKNPIKVEVTPQATTVEKIDQKINMVDKSNKLLLLKAILEQENAKSVLIFSRTKHGANRIVKYLDSVSINSAAIHGNKSQAARERALGDFRKDAIKVLVATDIAARGIDIPNISHVINFDMPCEAESYVHRIGRTARAGQDGIAISFCDSSEIKFLKAIERLIKFKVPIDTEHPLHGVKARIVPKEHADRRERPSSRPSERNRNSNNRRPFSKDSSDERNSSQRGFGNKSFFGKRRK